MLRKVLLSRKVAGINVTLGNSSGIMLKLIFVLRKPLPFWTTLFLVRVISLVDVGK